MKQRIYFSLSVLMVLFIWYNSSLVGSTSSAISTSVTTTILESLYRRFTLLPFTFMQFHSWIRKVGHVCEYAFLAFLLYQTFQLRFKVQGIFACCIGIAVIDELIQTQTIGRNGTVSDILLDSMAAGIVLWMCSQGHKKDSIYIESV